MDIENKGWEYRIQPGALRRVVMNLFGNAQKYTIKGYIILRLSINQSDQKEMLSLQIRDSGRGMSSEYMERKLYHPFAQEDSFAPGVGLGLSIVWSIVNQLGGKISVRSELGKGTDIDVNIPIERKNLIASEELPAEDSPDNSADARECIAKVREMAKGKKLSIWRRKVDASRYTDIVCLRRYCSEWFGFQIVEAAADIIVTDYYDEFLYQEGQRILLVYDDIAYIGSRDATKKSRYVVGNICQPLGPFKLARAFLLLLEQDTLPAWSAEPENSLSGTHMGTQTPLGTPEERTIRTTQGESANVLPLLV